MLASELFLEVLVFVAMPVLPPRSSVSYINISNCICLAL
uniref:Uncharacterized protein n=1 Tax=Anguilla anguilla TaxID=7936 RepID=A0A0E9QBJ3_ANGAN